MIYTEEVPVSRQPRKDLKLNTVPKKEISDKLNLKDEMLVLGPEVDHAIEKYFDMIKNQPEQDEEAKRLVSDLSDTSEENKIVSISEENIKNKEEVEVQHSKDRSVHTVKTGESIWRISQKYNVPIYAIESANPDKAGRIIRPGDRLKIPPSAGIYYTVKNGDSLSMIARKYKLSAKKIRGSNSLTGNIIHAGQRLFLTDAKPIPQKRYKMQARFIWPIRGHITSLYGWRRHPFNGSRQFHPGLDIGAVTGTAIHSTGKGLVVFAGDGGTYGNLIIIRHKDNYYSIYAHSSKLIIKKGQVVKQGQIIARVGNTGLSTGSHLHFEMKKGTERVNPLIALKIRDKVPLGI